MGPQALLILVTCLSLAGFALADQPPAKEPQGNAWGWHRLHDGDPAPPPIPPPSKAPPPQLPPEPPPPAAPVPSAPAPVAQPEALVDAAPTTGEPPVEGPPTEAPPVQALPAETPFAAPPDSSPSEPAPPPGAAGVALAWTPRPPPEALPPEVSAPAAAAPPSAVAPPPPVGPGPEAVAVTTALAATVVLGAGAHTAIHAWPRLRRWLAALLAPLYTRLAAGDALDNARRLRVFREVQREPGANLAGLKRATGLRNGALLHHLAVLQRHGYVRSTTDGRLRRFWASDARPRSGQPPLVAQVLQYVEEHPGMTNAAIADALAKRPTLVHYHVARLAREGQVQRERVGREVRLFASPRRAS